MGMFDCRARREHSGANAGYISRHEYDPASGWCAWSCGCRNDGRVVNKDGKVLNQGPKYTDAQLADFRQYLEGRYPRRPAPERPPRDLFDTLTGPMAHNS